MALLSSLSSAGLRFSLLCALGLALGCHSTPHEPSPVDPIKLRKIPTAQEVDATAVVQGNTAFACDLYQQLKVQEGNLFMSPYSLSAGLSMAFAGAAGQTRTEMAQVLHATALEPSRYHTAFGALQQSLDKGCGLGGYDLAIANRMFGQQGRAWSPDYLAILEKDYLASLQEMNFKGDAEGSRGQINAWVSDQTSGYIKELFAPGTIDSSTVFALADAIYFKGLWASQFDKSKTEDGTFHLDANNSVTVPFMHQTGKYPCKIVDGVRVLEMPYKGSDLSMIILVPADVDGLAGLEAKLTSENLAAWTHDLHDGLIMLSLPKFMLQNSLSLETTLKAMGMASAFSSSADFSGMDGAMDIFLQCVVHQAYVAVDEEGTVAAAATGVNGATAPPIYTFTMDHPFLFLILDRVTNSVLFLGRVTDPSKG